MNEWVSKIGAVIIANISVKGYVWRPSWNTPVRIYLLEDKDKNIFTIRSASNFIVGKKWRLDGMVKAHTIFNNQKQTHVSRWGLFDSVRQ